MIGNHGPCFERDFNGYEPHREPCFVTTANGGVPYVGMGGGLGWPDFSVAVPPSDIFRGTLNAVHARNGILPMFTCPYNQNAAMPNSSATLRVGQGGGDNWFDIRDWDPRAGITYETAIYFSQNTWLQASFGFIGFGDVPNLFEFLWIAQAEPTEITLTIGTGPDGTPPASEQIGTGFIPEPWALVRFRLEIDHTHARAFINGQQVADYDGPQTPQQMLCPEYGIWNKQMPAVPPLAGGPPSAGPWSRPWMGVDYVSIVQKNR